MTVSKRKGIPEDSRELTVVSPVGEILRKGDTVRVLSEIV